MPIPKKERLPEDGHVGAWIEWLSSIGKTENGGVTRVLYSQAWVEAQRRLKNKMEQAKLLTYFDSVGNLFGRLPGTEANGKTILTGSHIDTVVNGGKYDGAYGIIASFIATTRLYHKYGFPKKTIEVVSFCEEEGSRFPLAFWGSKNISGEYNLDVVREMQDADGTPFLQAMEQAGFDPFLYSPQIREDIACFVEIHIEQGMVLEKKRKQVGIVTHIVGQQRYTVQIRGECNHAGTTPMQYRKDAVCTAAYLISFLTERAKICDAQLVATVGKLDVKPNVPNVVAGEVEFSLDIRHHQEAVLNKYCHEIFAEFKRVSNRDGLEIAISQWMDVKPVKMDDELNKAAAKIAEAKNITYQEMISGAGHDAQVLAAIYPTMLLFVPSKSGISHSPKEFTKLEDLERGIELLTEILYELAY